MKKIIILLSVIFVMLSCASEKTVRYTVASKSADCIGVGPQKCMLVKKTPDKEWTFFYDQIEGFNYEEGYEYVLDVKEVPVKDVPADASSIKYVLVKEVSKEAKASENLPQNAVKEATMECVGKVIAVEGADVGKGGAAGKAPVTVVKIKVTSSTIEGVKEGDEIHAELVSNPAVVPVVDGEYIFKPKNMHPAHAKGIYMLDTDVLGLTK